MENSTIQNTITFRPLSPSGSKSTTRKENTLAMCEAFAEGAKEAGHEVEILHVGRMKIGGCLGKPVAKKAAL